MPLPDLQRAKRSSREPDTRLGWQGLTVPLPEEWSFAAFSGDWDSGYFRAEGPDGSTVEIKWKHDRASPSLKGVLKSYLKQLNKAAGRKGAEVELKEKPKALPSIPQGSGVSQTFSWRTEIAGVGAVWHCLECRRIVLAQVTSPDSAGADALARRIIPRIADHPAGDLCRWSVYDFTFSCPKELRLERQSLRSGHLSMELRDKRRRLVVERYGPANVMLKRDTLSDWSTAVKPVFDRLKPFRYRKVSEPAGSVHETVRLTGRRRGARERAYRILLWFIRREAPDALDARVWSCAGSNRIYLVMAEDRSAAAAALTNDVAASISCHAQPADDGPPGGPG